MKIDRKIGTSSFSRFLETRSKPPFFAIQSTKITGTSFVMRRLRLGSVTADGLTALGPLAAQD